MVGGMGGRSVCAPIVLLVSGLPSCCLLSFRFQLLLQLQLQLLLQLLLSFLLRLPLDVICECGPLCGYEERTAAHILHNCILFSAARAAFARIDNLIAAA